MAEKQSKSSVKDASTVEVSITPGDVRNADDELLAQLGYKSEFRREFTVSTHSNLAQLRPISPRRLALRDCRLRFLYHGRHSVCIIDSIISACIRRARWYGVWVAHS